MTMPALQQSLGAKPKVIYKACGNIIKEPNRYQVVAVKVTVGRMNMFQLYARQYRPGSTGSDSAKATSKLQQKLADSGDAAAKASNSGDSGDGACASAASAASADAGEGSGPVQHGLTAVAVEENLELLGLPARSGKIGEESQAVARVSLNSSTATRIVHILKQLRQRGPLSMLEITHSVRTHEAANGAVHEADRR